MSSGKRGFTLLEALVAALLLGTSVVASLGAIASITKAEATSKRLEQMQRLAAQKYDELYATGQLTTTISGDFTDIGISDYSWQATVTPTGTDSLNYISVVVSLKGGDSNGATATVETLLYAPSTTTTTGGSTSG